MCKVYNTIGSLTTIKTRLAQNGINDFHSVKELLSFQNSYTLTREQALSDQRALVTEERDALRNVVSKAENEIEIEKQSLQQKFKSEIDRLRKQYDDLSNAEKTIIQEFTFSFRALYKLIKVYLIQLTSPSIIARSIKPKVDQLSQKHERLHYLTNYFESVVNEKSWLVLRDLDHKKKVIDEINSFIYGAIGEQKVVEELRQLPDDFVLINDFTYSFNRAIYSRQTREYIKSIQIDHLLISPAGIFLIETKNWSKKSVESLNLRSPVQQIRRTSYALYKLLSSNLKLNHHWGERKIQLRNLIVLINHKPMGEFQYVKVLTLDELLRYVQHFKPSLSSQETVEIADYLVNINN